MTAYMERPGVIAPGSHDEDRNLVQHHSTGASVNVCYRSGCIEPPVKALGTTFLCRVHYSAFCRPIQRRIAGVPSDAIVGVGRYARPHAEYPASLSVAWLICDVPECRAEWVGWWLPEPLCPWCLRRVESRSQS